MKSKRFITLVVIFVISLLAGAAAFGFTAFADGEEGPEAPSFNASDYFTTGNDLVSIENDKLVIDFTAAGQKVVSRYDFYLPLTEVDTDVEVETNTGAAATAAGKLEITSKAEGKVTVEGITTNGNDLYLITNGEFNVGTEFYYVDDFTFASYQSGAYVQLWGYKYYDADFTVYHGFCKDIQKKIIITYGDIDVSSTATDYISEKTTDENVKVYSAPATIKFLDNSDNVTIRAYWGYYYVKENGNEGFYYKNAELQVEKELDATAPVYEGIDGFFAGGDDSEYAAYNNETVEKQLKSDGKYYQIGSSTYFYVIPNSELKNKGVDAFEPYFKKYVKSDYFPGEDLTAVVYYKTPGSDSFTKLSSTTSYKRFSLTDLGEYEYYVLATDPMGNEMEINEDWTLKSVGGVYGYYDDANALQIPVFCFSMGNAGPSAEKSDSYQVAGYVGTSYTKVNSFTTKGNDVSTQYSLWYNKGDVDSFPVTSGNDGWREAAAEAGWYEIGTEEAFGDAKSAIGWSDDDFNTLNWNDDLLSFTPAQTGSYVVVCAVSDSEALTAYDNTAVISVRSEVKRVELDTVSVWFQNNWKSLLFLGIAVLSLIGIIVLLFIKPKEPVTETDNE